MPIESVAEGGKEDPTTALLRYVTEMHNVATGLEALAFTKSNKLFPTYILLQKVWNKLGQLQDITGFTGYNPIWDNRHFKEHP